LIRHGRPVLDRREYNAAVKKLNLNEVAVRSGLARQEVGV